MRERTAIPLNYYPAADEGELASLRWRSFAPVALLAATLAGLAALEVASRGNADGSVVMGGLFLAFVCWVISTAAFFELWAGFRGRRRPAWAVLGLWANVPSVVLPPAVLVLGLLAAVLR